MDDKKLQDTAQALIDMFFNSGARVSKEEYDTVLLILRNVYRSGELAGARRIVSPTNG